MAFNPGFCAACGFTEGVHEHHIVPRGQGGLDLPTVYLCVRCHAVVHSRTWDPDHAAMTRAGLAAAKARGVKLGGDRGYRPVAAPDGRLGGEAVRLEADHAAHRVVSAIEAIRAEQGSDMSLQALARALTAGGVATPRGGAWTATAVRRALARTAG
jgi:hypothetical protein